MMPWPHWHGTGGERDVSRKGLADTGPHHGTLRKSEPLVTIMVIHSGITQRSAVLSCDTLMDEQLLIDAW